MSDKYAALRAAAEGAFSSWSRNVTVPTKELLALLAEREADKARIAQLESERDALREGEMGDAKHSNTRAAADIYFQLVEECNIPAGGSLVEYVDDLRDRIAELESRKVKLPGGFSMEEAKELHKNLVSSYISKAISSERMKKSDRDADIRWIHGVLVSAAWFVESTVADAAGITLETGE